MIRMVSKSVLCNVLSSLSCNEGESSVYLFLASTGVNNISSIATGLHFSRTTTYVHIEKLLGRGFVIKTKIKKRVLYEVCDPLLLLSEFENVYKDGSRALSALSQSLNETVFIPDVRTFAGEKEINSIFNDIASSLPKGGTYFRYTSRNNDYEKTPFYQILREQKELERLVITNLQKAESKKKDANRFIKTVPKDFAFDDNVTMLIYANKVAYIDYTVKMGVTIESPQLARFQEKIFKLLWKRL